MIFLLHILSANRFEYEHFSSNSIDMKNIDIEFFILNNLVTGPWYAVLYLFWVIIRNHRGLRCFTEVLCANYASLSELHCTTKIALFFRKTAETIFDYRFQTACYGFLDAKIFCVERPVF